MKAVSYPSYKDSGVKWLGDIPKEWEIKRLKTEAKYRVSNVDKVPSENELPVRLCNYTDVYYNEKIRADMELMETTATLDEIHRFQLHEGDVIITKDSEEWDDIAVPSLVVDTAPDLLCGYHLAIIRPNQKRLLGSYLFRALQSPPINNQFQVAATGVTRYGLPKSSIGEALLPIPSINEQHAIVNFLDSETKRIDTLIVKKRALIEKLKEKRTALISRTVTRGLPPDDDRAAGLDPNPKLKHSGIDWLGDVPEHWQISRLGWYIDLFTGYAFKSDLFSFDDGIPLIRGDNITEGRLRWGEKTRYWADSTIGLESFFLKNNDLVIGMDGSKVGKNYAIITQQDLPLILVQRVARIRIIHSINLEFLSFLIGSPLFLTWVDLVKTDPAVPHISPEDIRHFPIPLPNIKEQILIANYLTREIKNIDQLIYKVGQVITSLQEYRLSLITAAVTGKMDVRGRTV